MQGPLEWGGNHTSFWWVVTLTEAKPHGKQPRAQAQWPCLLLNCILGPSRGLLALGTCSWVEQGNGGPCRRLLLGPGVGVWS